MIRNVTCRCQGLEISKIFGQIFGQVFDHIFDQGFGEGKHTINTVYSSTGPWQSPGKTIKKKWKLRVSISYRKISYRMSGVESMDFGAWHSKKKQSGETRGKFWRKNRQEKKQRKLGKLIRNQEHISKTVENFILGHNSSPRKKKGAPLGGNSSYRLPGPF